LSLRQQYQDLLREICKVEHKFNLCAVKENAAETCASKCRISSADESLLSAEEPREVKTKQEYDACYSKCVAQETKEVAEEREKVSNSHAAPLNVRGISFTLTMLYCIHA